MMDIREIKTRDISVLNETLITMAELPETAKPFNDIGLMLKLVERMQTQTTFYYDRDASLWVFTNMDTDLLVAQEFFERENFVVAELDPALALARGIHYRYHKSIKP